MSIGYIPLATTSFLGLYSFADPKSQQLISCLPYWPSKDLLQPEALHELL